MKKVLLGVLAAVAVLILGVLGMAMTKPDNAHIERSAVIAAAPADIMPFLSDFTQFVKWSPWSKVDPNQTTTFSEPPNGEGAWYAWKGNDQVGEGKMTTLALTDTSMKLKLEFFAPWQAQSDVTYTLVPEGDGTKVTWAYDEPQKMMNKVMAVFMDMDAMLGADFEKGLASLSPLAVEAKAARVAAEAAAAAAAAEAAAAAAAADPTAAGAIPTEPGTATP
jgi:Polyketide cyclase / dehydrase and lipid transport